MITVWHYIHTLHGLWRFFPWQDSSRFDQLSIWKLERGESRIWDKVHQLWYALNCLNISSKRTFVPGIDLSFDEGGVASLSKYNPVRQYNKDKPDKRRVDFFIMANATKKKYFILHADIYQGKNAANTNNSSSIYNLPTTQKAVNDVIKCNLSMDSDGMRYVFMDNTIFPGWLWLWQFTSNIQRLAASLADSTWQSPHQLQKRMQTQSSRATSDPTILHCNTKRQTNERCWCWQCR